MWIVIAHHSETKKHRTALTTTMRTVTAWTMTVWTVTVWTVTVRTETVWIVIVWIKWGFAIGCIICGSSLRTTQKQRNIEPRGL